MNNVALLQQNQKQTSLLIEQKESSKTLYQALWLCIYFPKLAVHSLRINEEQSNPFVIFEAKTQKRTIHYASTAAQQLGIEAGMNLSQAYILYEQIKTYPRDPEKEQALIRILADWAIQFSPRVSIKYSSSVLIEIRGSVKLFDGIYKLQQKINQRLQKKGYLPSIAISPTPLASFIFSKASRNVAIEDKETLRSELGQLELQDFSLDRRSLEKLCHIGVQKGYELFRLSPASLARRFGNGFCRHLNELLGITHENTTPIQIRNSFYESYEFQKDQEDLEIILLHTDILLKSLIRFLIQRDLSTRELRFTMHSSNRKKLFIPVFSNTQCRNGKIWKNLIKERFYSTSFEDSIYKIDLHVDTFDPYIPCNETILQNTHKEHDSDWHSTLDQLAARLGKDCVSTLDSIEDHRPEHSYIKRTYIDKQSFKKNFLSRPYRPTWLLESPVCINNSINTLQKSCNIERIEDGWWDKKSIRRDYFIAKNKSHNLLWIFTDLKNQGQYFIHGYFA